MKKSRLTSDSVCLAMGNAVALNLMFENKLDHELFLDLWQRYLGQMTRIINYHLTPTGWIVLFKTNSEEEIKKAYHELRENSKKAKEEYTLNDVSKILSEHFRILLSQFVRKTNARHQRRGTKVLQSFHRYVLREEIDYQYFFDKITRGLRTLPQKVAKYQADERSYDEKSEMTQMSIWKVGTRMYLGLEEWFREKYGVLLLKPSSSVLRKFLQHSKFIIPKPPFS